MKRVKEYYLIRDKTSGKYFVSFRDFGILEIVYKSIFSIFDYIQDTNMIMDMFCEMNIDRTNAFQFNLDDENITKKYFIAESFNYLYIHAIKKYYITKDINNIQLDRIFLWNKNENIVTDYEGERLLDIFKIYIQKFSDSVEIVKAIENIEVEYDLCHPSKMFMDEYFQSRLPEKISDSEFFKKIVFEEIIENV